MKVIWPCLSNINHLRVLNSRRPLSPDAFPSGRLRRAAAAADTADADAAAADLPAAVVPFAAFLLTCEAAAVMPAAVVPFAACLLTCEAAAVMAVSSKGFFA
jgi:hypothetical protein